MTVEQRDLVWASGRSPWTWASATLTIPWQRMFDGRRAFSYLSQVLQILQTEDRPSRTSWVAQGVLVQCVKSLEQAALDGGSWTYARWLSCLAELHRSRRFAGSERELETMGK